MIANEFIQVVTNELHIYTLGIDMSIKKCILGYNDEVLDVKFEKRKNKFDRPFNVSNEMILVATNSSYLKLIDAETMEVRVWKAHEDIIMCVEYMEGVIVSGGKDNLVRVWNRDLELVGECKGHTGDVVGVGIGPRDMSVIASVSADGTLKLWDIKGGSESKRSVVAHEKEINCVRFAPNQKMVATASQDRIIKLWDEDLMLKL